MEQKPNRQRNTYLLLIAAGVFLLLAKWVHVSTLIAILLIYLGIQSLRGGREKRGYILLGIGVILVIGDIGTVVVALVLISLGYYLLKSKDLHREGPVIRKQNLIQSVRHDKEPWVLRSMSNWNLVGELNYDLSLALIEEKEVTLVLQGVVGDIDVLVPDYLGVSVESTVVFGQMDIARERGAGVMNRIIWQSPNYDAADTKVKLLISYIVGDVNVKLL